MYINEQNDNEFRMYMVPCKRLARRNQIFVLVMAYLRAIVLAHRTETPGKGQSKDEQLVITEDQIAGKHVFFVTPEVKNAIWTNLEG